jgi:putative membrane-bound dehydrogenase-like protein
MHATAISERSLFAAIILSIASLAAAQELDCDRYESTPRPAPAWVRLMDQGEEDPRLKGIRAPAGVRVEVAAEEPVVINPVGMTFDDAGRPLVIEWRAGTRAELVHEELRFRDGSRRTVRRMRKDARDSVKLLLDEDGDGRYESAQVVLDGLETPSSLLCHGGWIYFTSLGRVLRRRQSAPGGPWDVEEELIRGLCAFNQHQASGLTLSADGWLFVTSGDDDNHGEGSDGSRAHVLRCGAVFRCRPNGAELAEFARGFRNPYRDVALDAFENVFHLDNDQEDGSKFQGCRLVHVAEGADYGWRLAPGAVCCRPDPERAAVCGERPGMMPPTLKTGRGAPAGLLVYQGDAFPAQFDGLLIYPDVYRKLVRAYRVAQRGASYEVVEEFVLMESDDGLFRPCQALAGPDGAIYIVDWRTDSAGPGWLWGDTKHGRIWKLSWAEGALRTPEGARTRRQRWAKLRDEPDAALWELLAHRDGGLRRQALEELFRRGGKLRERLLDAAEDRSSPGPTRALALAGASRLWDADVARAAVGLLGDPDAQLRRLAADVLSRNVVATDIRRGRAGAAALDALAAFLRDPDAAPRRAAALALGRLASILSADDPRRQEAARRLLEALRGASGEDIFLRDGILRGLGRTGQTGVGLLVDLAVSGSAAERDLALLSLVSLRTADAARGLDAVTRRADAFEPAQLRRVLEAYRHIVLEPPVDTSALAALVAGEALPPALRAVGIESLALLGTLDSARFLPQLLAVLDRRSGGDRDVRLAALRAIRAAGLNDAAPEVLEMLRDGSLDPEERRALFETLASLRTRELPFGEKTSPGVDALGAELAALVLSPNEEALRPQLLGLLDAVDAASARKAAKALLASSDDAVARAAVEVLGRDLKEAVELGRASIEGKTAPQHLPHIVRALESHKEKGAGAEVDALLEKLFSGGFFLSVETKNVERVEALVRQSGSPERGRSVYLDPKRGQCVQCHKLEGSGRQVGPDLTGVAGTHTVAKLMSDILEPSKEVKEGFEAYTVTAADGRVLTGLRVSDTPTELVLRDAQGNDVVLPRADVALVARSGTSLMPSGLVKDLSLDDFVDLIAFLRDGPAQAALRGTVSQVWAVGPYSRSLLKADAPEKDPDPRRLAVGDDGSIHHWKLLSAGPDGAVDLNAVAARENSSAYALFHVHAPKAEEATLRLSFRQKLRLLVNGATTFQSEEEGKDFEVRAPLRAGWNTVLCRVVRLKGDAALRIAVRGSEGLRVSADPPGE